MRENKNIDLRDFLKNKLLFCMNLVQSFTFPLSLLRWISFLLLLLLHNLP